ncbi:MAG: glycosyltransferase family 2 protein [Firmicutes bacterium]|nr:glycosyltransferase family 2 protein [Bacillota bacterium]
MNISVIMLTYNRENFVTSTIQSILAQNFPFFEFIIVDNGSTDNSGSIAEKFANQDSRIKVIHIEKSNIGTGRNRGLDLAKGDYITFIDDDDMAEPDMLEFLYKLVIDHNADISICGSTKKINGEIFSNYVFSDCLVMTAAEAVVEMLKRKKYNVAMPTKLIRRELFNKVRFFETGKYDDITVGYRFFANANKVVAHGLPKYCFYRHPKNNSAFTTNDQLLNSDQLDEYFAAFRERTKYLSELLPDIADYAQYSEWSYMISMCNKISRNKLVDCSKQLEIIKKELSDHFEEFYNSSYIEDFEKNFMNLYLKP